MKRRVLLLGCWLTILQAATITVDPVNGPDTSIGMAVAKAQAGDVIQVKAGIYREQIRPATSGEAGGYITIRPVPGETVIMDGSLPLTGWTKCSSAAEVKDNPNWSNIYWTATPSGIPATVINVYEGEALLRLGQHPEPDDAYFDRQASEFMPTPPVGYTVSQIVDPSFFTQTESDYWKYSQVYLYAPANAVYSKRILSYDAGAHAITFGALSSIDPGNDRYAVANHPSLIKRAGQYYYDELGMKLYLWPLETGHLEDGSITISKKSQAFYLSGVSYYRIEDLTIRRYTKNAVFFRVGSDYNILKGCCLTQGIAPDGESVIFVYSCRNTLVDSCRVTYNKYNKGLVFQGGSDNVVARSTFIKNGGTCLDFYTETNSGMVGNYLQDHMGVHANGLTCYESCRDVVLTGNQVFDGRAALTYEMINGITVTNNILHGNGGWAACCWDNSSSSNVTFYHNTIISGGSYAFYSQNGSIVNLRVQNNILDGVPDDKKTGLWSHNLYINPSHNAGNLKTGELRETDKTKVFVDFGGRDYQLKAGSPAIDAGTDVGVTTDIESRLRPFNGAPDMGAHEYGSYVYIHVRSQRPQAEPAYLVFASNPVTVPGPVTFTMQGQPVPHCLDVCTPQGKTLARIYHRVAGTVYTWDGKDRQGRVLASGVYLLKADGQVIKKITVSR